MTPQHIINGEAWCMSLRKAMGYPLYAPACHTLAWAATERLGFNDAIAIGQVAQDMGRDLVVLEFDHSEAAAPISLSLVIRHDECAEWIPGCTLYSASNTAKFELLGGGRRWHIGSRLFLTSQKLPPNDRRIKGEQIAMRRWRQLAAAMEPLDLIGTVLLAPGTTFAGATPFDLGIAA